MMRIKLCTNDDDDDDAGTDALISLGYDKYGPSQFVMAVPFFIASKSH